MTSVSSTCSRARHGTWPPAGNLVMQRLLSMAAILRCSRGPLAS